MCWWAVCVCVQVSVCVCAGVLALMWAPVSTDSSPSRAAGCGAVWYHRDIWTWCVYVSENLRPRHRQLLPLFLPLAFREVHPTFDGTWRICGETVERMRLFVLWRASRSARSYIKELECGRDFLAFYRFLPLRIHCFPSTVQSVAIFALNAELNLQHALTYLCCLCKDTVRALRFFGECVSACACARKPLLTEAQGVASCSTDRTGPSGYNQNKEAHWGKHNKTFPQVLLLH